MDAGVHALDAAHRRQRLGGAAEDDGQGQLQGAHQPLQRLLLEAAVLGDAGGDQRMGNLQEQGAPAAEQQHRLAVDPPGDAVGGEEAGGGIDPAAAGGGAQAGEAGAVDGRGAHRPSNEVGLRPSPGLRRRRWWSSTNVRAWPERVMPAFCEPPVRLCKRFDPPGRFD